MINKSPKSYKKQQGAVLAISLIILLVLTVVVMSGNQTVVMQEKMTASVRDAHISLQDAEIGLLAAATQIESLTGTGGFSDAGTGGFYSQQNGPINVFDSANWASGKYLSTTNPVTGNTIQYYIEDVDIIPVPDEDLSGINMMGYGQTTGGGDVNAFKVVSRATGMSGTAERVVVGFYGKRL